ncbi:succinyldiaminopimelate aminotransferase [Microlunatus phosphovorus NM-1]|uniref:Aminotransferase n=1 Tax=Microlunatus phosphovorus (strain ATCC 700054 / DSM 10555 / JCM 9379 / NBRC 101784 / NCIMB 13414 / VKM Ac-1990 / NM-1) TaxID=1032480 RepID=F5XSS9_MICPN|nr:succinyldiaminopimelate transaminase [Microlunatus phosphovorus]BAK37337.1 succinyldiaminopimelate aminotransferase [Microlunatus phosphovorus NM-1]
MSQAGSRARGRRRLAASLPDFPWDSLAEAKAVAATHPDGIIDLSVGTPVDPTPQLGQRALADAADSPGYPQTAGTPRLREAIAGYLGRRWGATGLVPDATLPVIGTKELVAWLPTLLGLGPDDLVVFPTMAYPTYEVGARIAGCQAAAVDDLTTLTQVPGLVWLNSPGNPTGQILSADELKRRVDWARERGAIVASDECYGEFGWDAEPVSVLHPSICDGDHTGLLALHSLSKRSNLAGYRAGFVAGDAALVAELLAVRKHAGMIVPRPVQEAMRVLLDDQSHVVEQYERYRRRRALLRPALEQAGFTIDHSEGSLYLWATRGESGRDSVAWLAERGILAAPGDFYGAAAAQHVRVALTGTDERIAAAVARLAV